MKRKKSKVLVPAVSEPSVEILPPLRYGKDNPAPEEEWLRVAIEAMRTGSWENKAEPSPVRPLKWCARCRRFALVS